MQISFALARIEDAVGDDLSTRQGLLNCRCRQFVRLARNFPSIRGLRMESVSEAIEKLCCAVSEAAVSLGQGLFESYLNLAKRSLAIADFVLVAADCYLDVVYPCWNTSLELGEFRSGELDRLLTSFARRQTARLGQDRPELEDVLSQAILEAEIRRLAIIDYGSDHRN